jgi:hypothetical protein
VLVVSTGCPDRFLLVSLTQIALTETFDAAQPPRELRGIGRASACGSAVVQRSAAPHPPRVWTGTVASGNGVRAGSWASGAQARAHNHAATCGGFQPVVHVAIAARSLSDRHSIAFGEGCRHTPHPSHRLFGKARPRGSSSPSSGSAADHCGRVLGTFVRWSEPTNTLVGNDHITCHGSYITVRK